MHIKLILPTNYDLQKELFKVKRATIPNLTVRYLAAMVPAGHKVTVLEESVHDVDFDEPIDLVALSVLTANSKRAYEIAERFRQKGVPVVMGGIHVTCCPEEASAHADAIVIGEAEDGWPELIDDFEKGRLQRVYEKPRRESLAHLPHPRFDLIDPSDYLSVPFLNSMVIPIQTTRGCPHDCDFCVVTRLFGAKVRHRPIEDVVEEIQLSRSRVFFFTDDNFFANHERTEALCKALLPLKIKYACQLDTLSYRRPDLVRLLGESGCVAAYIGIESLQQSNLNAVNKDFSKVANFAELFRVFRDNGIGIYASIILGFDRDLPLTAEETVKFLTKQKAILAGFFPLTPIPATALYKRLKEEGRLYAEEFWLSDDLQIRRSKGIKYAEDQWTGIELVGRAMKQFYSLPSISRRLLPPRHAVGVSAFFWGMNLDIRKKVMKTPYYYM